MAASGGYWLMCAGDKAYALEGSLVGSIGVISASFGAVEASSWLGIERRIYTAGESKSQLDPFMPVQPEQVRVGAAGGLRELALRDPSQKWRWAAAAAAALCPLPPLAALHCRRRRRRACGS